MSIKPVLVPDQDAKTLRALLESFDAAASGPTKKQLTESVEAVVEGAMPKFIVTFKTLHSSKPETAMVSADDEYDARDRIKWATDRYTLVSDVKPARGNEPTDYTVLVSRAGAGSHGGFSLSPNQGVAEGLFGDKAGQEINYDVISKLSDKELHRAHKFSNTFNIDPEHAATAKALRAEIKKRKEQGVAEGRDDDDDIWTSSKSGGPKGLPQGRRGQTGREMYYDVDKKYDDYAPDDEGDDWYDDLDEASGTIDSEEYNDEAGMAHSNLITIARAAEGLLDTIDDNENLPEWAQEKIAKVEGMLVAVWDYLESQEQQGIDPEIESESFYESAAWRRKEGKNKNGGLNAKGVASYRRENPGSKLQTAVTTKPSKLKPGSKAAKRRKSFCARMSGVKGPMKKPNGKPTRKALALRKWNCESIEQSVAMLESVGQNLKELKQRLDPKCWKGKKIGNPKTKIKGGVRVNNCVPANESINESVDPVAQLKKLLK